MHEKEAFERDVPEEQRISARGIEVGHIFNFGTKYSDPMKASVSGPEGKDVMVEMGSYGIGVSRLLGALIEAFHDEQGCVWPIAVAPFHVGLVNLKVGDGDTDSACASLYAALGAAGLDVLYDNTGARAGEKFARMDLIGLPFQITIGPRGLKSGVVEIKTRATGEKQELAPEAAVAFVREQIMAGLAVS